MIPVQMNEMQFLTSLFDSMPEGLGTDWFKLPLFLLTVDNGYTESQRAVALAVCFFNRGKSGNDRTVEIKRFLDLTGVSKQLLFRGLRGLRKTGFLTHLKFIREHGTPIYGWVEFQVADNLGGWMKTRLAW